MEDVSALRDLRCSGSAPFHAKTFFFLVQKQAVQKHVNKIDIQKAVNVFIWKTVVKVNWRMLFQTHFRETQWRSKR